jgi:AraC-like DNA-binding protein
MNRKIALAEKVKELVAEMMLIGNAPEENDSVYISKKMHLNYTYVANIFKERQGITIERYIIEKRVEKAGQLLHFSAYSVQQIACMLHYSSIGHFSNQFKKVKGITPTAFKKQKPK